MNVTRAQIFKVTIPIIWFFTVVVMFLMMADARNAELFKIERYVLQGIYVLLLMWYLIRSGTTPNIGININYNVSPFWKYVRIITITIILLAIIFTNLGTPLLILMLMIATFWILIVWRKEIKLKTLSLGVFIMLVAIIGGFLLYENNFVSKGVFIILPVFVPFMFTAGTLLIKKTNIGKIQLLEGNYSKPLKSLFMGCLLFIPLGMFNAASGSPGDSNTWVTNWWMPLVTPWFSGIVEETWYRLFLIGLCSLLILPSFRKNPSIAIIISVLFSAIVFGLGHGRTLDNFLITGLLYGLPLSVVFVKRDFEHAVGAHYMINMIPMLFVSLETLR